MGKLVVQRIDDLDRRFVACEQDSAREDGAAKPHCGPFPESSDTVVEENAFDSFSSAGSFSALRPCLDYVERLVVVSAFK